MGNEVRAKKLLGQHWLRDEKTLDYIVSSAQLLPGEAVLEIGPGTGTLTAKLLEHGAKVIAVEKDEALAANLENNLSHHLSTISEAKPWQQRLVVVGGDILKFDLTNLPPGYKVVANIPYYLTSNLIRFLSESLNPPSLMVMLVQKEVAERIAAKPGQMSLLSVSVQLYYESKLGQVVPAKLFTPPPKVDSQLIILKRHLKPPFKNLDSGQFFQIVRAGFSERRKKLRSSLSGGLHLNKEQSDGLLLKADIDANRRAQELPLEQWYKLYLAAKKFL